MALSPTMQYYRDTKQEYPDAIVLLRLGDFYEIFFEDAREAAALLDLTLTSRGSGPDRIPMCGVPYHAVQGYIARLIKAGRKVAICDQLEDPKTAKGLVKRGVTRVVTPSTFVESEDDPGSPSLLGLSWTGTVWGVAWLEPATGLLQFWEAGADALGDALDRVGPSEMVTTKSVAASPLFSAGPRSAARNSGDPARRLARLGRRQPPLHPGLLRAGLVASPGAEPGHNRCGRPGAALPARAYAGRTAPRPAAPAAPAGRYHAAWGGR